MILIYEEYVEEELVRDVEKRFIFFLFESCGVKSREDRVVKRREWLIVLNRVKYDDSEEYVMAIILWRVVLVGL